MRRLGLRLALVLLVLLPACGACTAVHAAGGKNSSEALGRYLAGWLEVLEARDLDRRGLLAEGAQAWRRAAEAFEAALQADRSQPDIYRALALCYIRLNEQERLTRTLARLSQILPPTVEGRKRLAEAYEELGRNSEAIQEYRRALEVADDEAEKTALRRKVAELYRAMGRPQEAVPFYQEILRANEADLEARMSLAYAFSEAGRHEEAVAAVNALIARGLEALGDELSARALGFLASEYERADKASAGAARFAELLRDHPEQARIAELLVLLLERAGKVEEAIAQGRDFLARHPDAPRLAVIVASLLERANQPAAAIALYRQILASPSPKHGALKRIAAGEVLALAIRRGQAGDEASAEQALRLLLDAGAGDLPLVNEVPVRQHLAGIYARQGRAAEAVQVLRPLADAGVMNASLRALFAELLEEAGQGAEAVRMLTEAIAAARTREDEQELRFGLAQVYARQRRDDLAEPQLQIVLALNPEHAGAANHLGYLYAEQNRNLEEAVRLIELALKKEPNQAAYIDSLGWAYYKMALRDNDPARLEMSLEKLREADKGMDDAVISDHLGDVCFVAGRWEEAVAAWNRSLELARKQKRPDLPNPAEVEAKRDYVLRLLEQEKQAGTTRAPAERMKKPLAPVRVEVTK